MEKTISAQELAVETLKSRLTDIQQQDTERLQDSFYLFQWLKSQNFNIDKAEQVIRNSFRWRKEKNVSTSASVWDVPIEMQKKFPYHLDGMTKSGRLVATVNAHITSNGGLWDMKSFIEAENGHGDKFLDHINLAIMRLENLWLEHNQKLANKQGENFAENADGVIFLINIADFPFRQIRSKKLVGTIIEILKNIAIYFPPSMISDGIFINAPKVAHILFKVLTPFFSFLKLQIYDSDERKWRAAIEELMEISTLHQEFGGTRYID